MGAGPAVSIAWRSHRLRANSLVRGPLGYPSTYVPTLWYMIWIFLRILLYWHLARNIEHRSAQFRGADDISHSRHAFPDVPKSKVMYLYHYSKSSKSDRHHPYTPPMTACEAAPLHSPRQLSEWHRAHISMTGTIDNSPRKIISQVQGRSVTVIAVNGVNMIHGAVLIALSGPRPHKCCEVFCA